MPHDVFVATQTQGTQSPAGLLSVMPTPPAQALHPTLWLHCGLSLLTILALIVSACWEEITTMFSKAETLMSSVMAKAAVSTTEARTFASVFVINAVFCFAASTSSDDSIDSALIVVLASIVATLVVATLSLLVSLIYSLSSTSGGEAVKKVAASDVFNTALCALRVVLC